MKYTSADNVLATQNRDRPRISRFNVPAHADAHKSRAQAYEKRLEELDSYIVAKIDSIPASRRKLINQIASEANVKVGPPLSPDALGQPGTDGDTYLKMMRYNADTLANTLKS